MKRQITYAIYTRGNIDSLTDAIERQIEKGWKLQGGASCMFVSQNREQLQHHPDIPGADMMLRSSKISSTREVFIQAVIKKESWITYIKRILNKKKGVFELDYSL